MIKPRIYTDTSVIGGCLDAEFATPSLLLFDNFKSGRAVIVLSNLTLLEVQNAPEVVRGVLTEVPVENIEYVEFTKEAGELAQLYIAEGVIGERGPEMNVRWAIETFSRYSLQEKADFLLQFAHTLTILARDTYEVGKEGPTNPSRLRLINEVQYRVMSFLMALIRNEEKRYPDEVLVRIILEHPEDLELQRQLQEMFDHLMTQQASPGGSEMEPGTTRS